MSLPDRTVILSSKAYLSILTETYHHMDTETGGIFLGKSNGDKWYILETIDPGYEKAIRRHAYFEYDKEYVTHLANIRSRMYKNGLDVLGLWHRHPGSFDQFSATDDETNIRFARLCRNGALSALVNLTPDIRLTFYHVMLPLKYTLLKNVLIGESHIPGELKQLKKPHDLNQTARSQTIIENEIVVNHGNDTKKDEPMSPQTDEQDAVLKMLDNELQNYLEKQSDYQYDLKMDENRVIIEMKYLGSMPYYPDNLTCELFVDKRKKKYRINDTEGDYHVGVIYDFVKNHIDERILEIDREYLGEASGADPQKKRRAESVLSLEGGYTKNDIKRSYRALIKDYHPDNWIREGNETLTRAAHEKMFQIQEAYSYLMENFEKAGNEES